MMDYPTPCTIGVGSNTADREERVNRAIEHVTHLLSKSSVSSVYESDAINGKDAPYLNAVIHGLSPVNSTALVKFLKEWEIEEGRQQDDVAHGQVSIDIDLVIFDSRILRPKDFERHYFNIGYRELLANGSFQDE